MSNAKRVLDSARTYHLELCADAAVVEGPLLITSADDRARGSEILSRAFEEQLLLPDVFAEISNAIARSINAIVTTPKVKHRLLNSIDEHLQDAIGSDLERAKAASASPRLASIALHQAIHIGADAAIRALLDDELIRRMPPESHRKAAETRKSELAPDAPRAVVQQHIGRHLALRIRDPRDPRIGARLHLPIVPPPFFEKESEEKEEAAQATPPTQGQPSFVAAENGRPLKPREIVLRAMAKCK